MVILLSELTGLKLCVGAHLKAFTKEKVEFIARPEF